MAIKYGELLKEARINHNPPMTAKELADQLNVKPPFITDIEKGRRLPSLENQKKIKKLLVSEKFSAWMFDDLAAAANDDPRIVSEDIATAIREKPALRELIRTMIERDVSASQIREFTAKIGGANHVVK